jgi:hypothetical protein
MTESITPHRRLSHAAYGALQSNGTYPLAATTLANGTPATVTVSGESSAYPHFAVAAGQTGTIQWGALPPAMQLTLVRTR